MPDYVLRIVFSLFGHYLWHCAFFPAIDFVLVPLFEGCTGETDVLKGPVKFGVCDVLRVKMCG